ncbi:hypothetical protein [Planctomonas deserti]|uniref:hypothetical protein n=1 Tax=Planctomonas deserti TaxID=2144185 RepID=UPI000D33A95E|nr:hypothetical protein [Planctomonas deserti]
MKHLTYADKNLLVGDEVADLLLQYAARLASSGVADTVDVHAISSDGDEVTATFLLGEGAPLMTETTHSTVPEPDNTGAVQQITERMGRLVPTAVETELDPETAALNDLYNEA